MHLASIKCPCVRDGKEIKVEKEILEAFRDAPYPMSLAQDLFLKDKGPSSSAYRGAEIKGHTRIRWFRTRLAGTS